MKANLRNCRAFFNLKQPRKHMRVSRFALIISCLNVACSIPVFAQTEPIKTLVGRLDLAKYKTTLKGLTQFGDRKQGTDRNRAAVNWIEAQLKRYGCANVSRVKYTYSPTEGRRPSGPAVSQDPDAAAGGGRFRGVRGHTGVNVDPQLQPDEKLR